MKERRAVRRCECGSQVDVDSVNGFMCGTCTTDKYSEVFSHRVSSEFNAFKALLYGSILLLITCIPAYASPSKIQGIPEDLAVKCVLGEASNQGAKGMQAVGEVLRRRGSTKGLYGCKNAVSGMASAKLRAQAREAWKASERSNLTKGADHFENVEAFGVPKWARSLKPVAKIGNHTFYRVKS